MTRPDIEAMRQRCESISDYAQGDWSVDSTSGDYGPLVYNSVMPSKDEKGQPEPILTGPQMSSAMWKCDDEEDGCPACARDAIAFTEDVVRAVRTDLPACLDYIASLEAALRDIMANGGAWEKRRASEALGVP